MPAPYQALLFDVGQTLVRFCPSTEAIVLQAWNDAGLSVTEEQLRATFRTAWDEDDADAATATFPATQEYDHEAWLARERRHMHMLGCEREDVFDGYVRRVRELFALPGAIRPYEETLDVLVHLKRKGYRLGIVSNWSWNLVDRCRQAGIDGYFDVIMASAYAGCNKPNPCIFVQTLEKLAVPAARAIHIGDRYDADVLGARSAGVDAVLLDRAGSDAPRDCPVVRDLWEFVELAGAG